MLTLKKWINPRNNEVRLYIKGCDIIERAYVKFDSNATVSKYSIEFGNFGYNKRSNDDSDALYLTRFWNESGFNTKNWDELLAIAL